MQITLHRKKHRQIIPELYEIEERFKECPFCKSKEIRFVGSVITTPEINVMTCRQCHIGYIDRQPTETFLREFYKKYYSKDDQHTTIDPHVLVNHLIRQFGKLRTKNTFSILDFGGGDGSVSQLLANYLLTSNLAQQVNIINVDYNAGDGEGGHSSYNIVKNNLPSFESIPPGKKFDLVIASAILEHVKNPRETLSVLLNYLEENGVFYARTPWVYPILNALTKVGIYIDLPYPAHLFDMGNAFWNSILKTLNLSSDFSLEKSCTSLVQSSFREHPLRTLIAHLLKIPSYIFKNHYHFVGGWEVIIKRKAGQKK